MTHVKLKQAKYQSQINHDYIANTLYEVHSNMVGYTPFTELIQRMLKRNIESLGSK